MPDMVISLNDLPDYIYVDLMDWVTEYITEKTGFCVSSFSYEMGDIRIFDLDLDEEEE